MSATRKIRELLLLPREIRECPEIISSIRDCIEKDNQALEYYIRWMRFEAAMHSALSHEAAPALVVSAIRNQSRRLWGLRGAIACIACLITFCLIVGSILLPAAKLSREAGQPILAARIEATGKVVWSREIPQRTRSVAPGEWISFQEGTLPFYMGNGAELTVQGPASLRLVNAWEVELREGKLCAYVGPPARGFRVKSGDLTVVDLGTIFTVSTFPGAPVDVHVLQGTVTAESKLAPKAIINAGVAHKYEEGGKLLSTGPAEVPKFVASLRKYSGISEISGSIEFLPIPPTPGEEGSFPTPTGGVCFPEQLNIMVQQPLKLFSATPGTWSQTKNPELVEIPPGTRVSTYLIHSEKTSVPQTEATIQFKGRILGLALTEQQLQDTDLYYGIPFFKYPAATSKGRRGAVATEVDDEIRIHGDRRSLDLKINFSGGALDQIRVFVAADSDD